MKERERINQKLQMSIYPSSLYLYLRWKHTYTHTSTCTNTHTHKQIIKLKLKLHLFFSRLLVMETFDKSILLLIQFILEFCNNHFNVLFLNWGDISVCSFTSKIWSFFFFWIKSSSWCYKTNYWTGCVWSGTFQNGWSS